MKIYPKSLAIDALALLNTFPTGSTDAKQLRALLGRLSPLSSDKELIRMGPRGDGGYLLPDDLAGIEALFSPGVNEVSGFELEAMFAPTDELLFNVSLGLLDSKITSGAFVDPTNFLAGDTSQTLVRGFFASTCGVNTAQLATYLATNPTGAAFGNSVCAGLVPGLTPNLNGNASDLRDLATHALNQIISSIISYLTSNISTLCSKPLNPCPQDTQTKCVIRSLTPSSMLVSSKTLLPVPLSK